MLKRSFFLFSGFLTFCTAYAQVDTEFWFAPPEVTAGHGDRPIFLRISTLDKAANVVVVQPARQNAQIGAASIPANGTHTFDLTKEIFNLETTVAAWVMGTGIRITSSAPVTAYYEIASHANADIFALKGRNALGNKFIIPVQNLYQNDGYWHPTPSFSFDVVATADNTVVKVTPTKPIIGHLSDSVITIKLNKGQTYCFRKPTLGAEDNPAGTIVESSKPIAITLKDDSLITGCADLVGDQLVPVQVAGSEYVVLKGFLDIPEYVFITATEDATKIFLDGQTTPAAMLSAGEVFRYEVTQKSIFIRSDKTIYVLHITGFGCEIGLAVLPSINCKGSPQIGFSRTTSDFFGLNVLVRKEGISNFVLNGSSSLVPASAFTPVKGTSDQWYTAQLSFSTTQIQVDRASLISNHQNSFQVGIIHGDAATTCRYGYFSSFSTLFIGDDLSICEGETAVLDAGPGKESYLWNTGQTSQQITVSAGGDYWVKVAREDCILYDTITVQVKKGQVDLGPDIVICPGDTAKIDGLENFSWQWSDGSTGQFLKTMEAGQYWVSVFDYTGCVASDTIALSFKESPDADLGDKILKCEEHKVTLDATFPDATYLWQDGGTFPFEEVSEAGTYWVRVTWNGCSASDTVLVENLPGPVQDSIYGSPSVCPFAEDIRYYLDTVPNSTYKWFIEGGSIDATNEHEIIVDWFDSNSGAMIKAVATDSSGCKGDTIYYPVRINVVLLPEIPYGPDTLCLNKSQQVVYHTPVTNGSVYQWNIFGGEITAGQGSEEVVINWSDGLNRLWIEETSVTIDTVCYGISPELLIYVFKDTTQIILQYVSVDTSQANVVQVRWNFESGAPGSSGDAMLYRRKQGSGDWQLTATLPSGAGSFNDPIVPIEHIYEYYLSLTNFCDVPLSTNPHHIMLLNGVADSITGLITLQWNHYFGWPTGVDHYEVWRETDLEPGYKFLATVPAHANAYAANLASDAFKHRYIIRAVQHSGPNESWSTPLVFDFEHAVKIPNIITPNGDRYNQYFHIDKIELYRRSELTILDRWGKRVYHTKNYQNDWDGRGLSSGVYFYVLDLKEDNKIYKGTLTIF